ncbi:MAG: hypothetical protein MUC71_08035 [Steroidobacteraceae bacterium]|jgi:hypothetical protein|nr:hypothetical protein [Steroidobacteraceae bacterium]
MRRPAPDRMRLAAAWAFALVVVYGAFEFGRHIAGYSAATAFAQRFSLATRVDELGGRVKQLEAELAARDVTRRVDQEAQAETQAMMGELQAELARQQQDLDFYRGLVAERFGGGSLRIQELSVEPVEGERAYVVEVTLVQTTLRDQLANGTLTVSLDGARRGALLRLPMRELAEGGRSQVTFTLRYFQTVRIPIVLPEGFEPASIRVEFRSSRGGPEAQQQTFPWASVLETPPAGFLTPGPVAG